MAVKTYGIHDQWTDLNKLNDVEIKSVNGVVESVKINGEESGGGGGGGSSDFSTATVTISGLAEMASLPIPVIDPEYGETWGIGQTAMNGENTVVLYKGVASLYTPLAVVVTGDIIYDSDLEAYFIHGDGTITVSA